MKKFLVMMILLSLVLAINPPQNGNFPDGFWEKMNEQNIGQTYGDPGWVRKIIWPLVIGNRLEIT